MSGLATGLFAIRNTKRTSNGEYGRFPVAVGQIAKGLKEFSHQSNIFAKGVRGALDTAEEIAKYDKICGKLAKAVKFASEHVNPLIVCSSGVNVLLAKNKESTIITESGTLTGMFATEAVMKRKLDKLIDALPISAKWKPIIRGFTFVAGSITGSTIGHHIGSKTANSFKKDKIIAEQTGFPNPLKQQNSYNQLSLAA